MAAGFMTHVTCRLTAKNRDQLRNSTPGNRVWATFTVFYCMGIELHTASQDNQPPTSRLTRSESQPRGSKQHSSAAGKVTEVLAARRPCARDRAVYGLNFLRKEDTSIRPHFCKDYVNVYICPLLCTQLNSTQPASTDAGVNISISASI